MPIAKPEQATAASVCELDDSERTRCEVWTRVMGYHRPVSAWNPGKQAEHAERRYYVYDPAVEGSASPGAPRQPSAARPAPGAEARGQGIDTAGVSVACA